MTCRSWTAGPRPTLKGALMTLLREIAAVIAKHTVDRLALTLDPFELPDDEEFLG
ncbi:hypothetical protein PBI_KALPINE_1 [Mycobacterium phage Kalpine]|nr:hypothetical protein PBI_KALPINE_1 [Mycobacterium phage Kalpine]